MPEFKVLLTDLDIKANQYAYSKGYRRFSKKWELANEIYKHVYKKMQKECVEVIEREKTQEMEQQIKELKAKVLNNIERDLKL